MGYIAYCDGLVTTSRDLTKSEMKYITDKWEDMEGEVSEDQIIFPSEYSGICPDEYLEDDIKELIKYGKRRGFTISGEIDLDMEMGCAGKRRYKIKDSVMLGIIDKEEDFLEDYSDETLIAELKSRGYTIRKKGDNK